MKKSVGSIRLDLAQYREMQAFSQFGGDLDPATARQLKYGAGLMQLLRQGNNSPMSLHRQVITLICAQAKMFVEIPPRDIKKVQTELLDYFELHNRAVCHQIEHYKTYSDDIRRDVSITAKRFFDERYGGIKNH